MARALIQGLRARGFDVLTPLDTEMMGEPDEAQLDFSAKEGRVLYTFNVGDFCGLHAEYMESERSHPGIVVVPRQRYSIGGLDSEGLHQMQESNLGIEGGIDDRRAL